MSQALHEGREISADAGIDVHPQIMLHREVADGGDGIVQTIGPARSGPGDRDGVRADCLRHGRHVGAQILAEGGSHQLETEIMAALGEGRVCGERHDDLGRRDVGMMLAGPLAHRVERRVVALRSAAREGARGIFGRVEEAHAHADHFFFDAADVFAAQGKDSVVGQEHVVGHPADFLDVLGPAKGPAPMTMDGVGGHGLQLRLQGGARHAFSGKFCSIVSHESPCRSKNIVNRRGSWAAGWI